MRSQISLFFFVFLYWRIIFSVTGTRPLTAINNSASAARLYLGIQNEEMPIEDPAFSDRHIRRRICRDITRSGFFELIGLKPIHMEHVFDELKNNLRYRGIFDRIFVAQSSVDGGRRPIYKYNNEFQLMEFIATFVQKKEFVFVCVLRDVSSNNLVARYVTKEYNVLGNPYKPGRFVLPNIELNSVHDMRLFESIYLAEEPATITEYSDSNIELRYLQLRRFRELARYDNVDPLCKLLNRTVQDNYHYRFCVAILKSPNFVEKFAYPKKNSIYDEGGCLKTKVSFRTPEGRQAAGKKTYFERMTQCRTVLLDSSVEVIIYISRAYASEHLFTYEVDSIDGNMYLTNLSADLALLDIPIHVFEDVED